MSAAIQTATKGEFAAIMGVSPGRVSQWIKEGKIGPDAMDGEGHRARIVVKLAQDQIAGRTDAGQRFGNGLKTALRAEDTSALTAPAGPLTDRPPTVAEQIAAEQLKKLQQQTRRGEEEERARLGIYTPTTDVRRAMGRLAVDLMATIEGGLPEIATDLSARFSLPQRDVLHALRDAFRKVRERAAREQETRATALPTTIVDSDATDDDVEPTED